MMRTIALLAACLGVLMGSAYSQQTVRVTLTGAVLSVTADGTAQPWLGDSTVRLSYRPAPGAPPQTLATTSGDATGRFAFFELDLLPGTYELSAVLEQTGASDSITFDVTPEGEGQTLDFTIAVRPVAVRGGLAQPPAPFVTVPVYFATDRKPGPSDPFVGASFLNEVSSPYALSYGKALVTIPKTHERGRLEGPDVRIDLRADRSNHIILEKVSVEPEGAFFAGLRDDLNANKSLNPRRRIVVFIHGYHNGFDHAVRTAAQIKYDLLPSNVTMVLYSWPSRNTLLGYFDDENASNATVGALKTFLVQLSSESRGAQISVIAHSMGNAALMQAMRQIAADKRAPKPLFDKVIMAAPDVPAADVMQNSCTLASLSRGMTLYASKHDQALLAADVIARMQDLAGYRREDPIRAGLANPLVVPLGIDTVDASSAITDLLGHGYFTHDVEILADIQEYIEGAPPPRTHLVPETLQDKSYWLFTARRDQSAVVKGVVTPHCP